ncbi:MAG: hypothetical protein ACYC3I_26075 [Gemmataceae bacterium]
MASDVRVSTVIAKLGRLVAAVNRPGEENSELDRTLDILQTLSRKEGIPLAIVGGMAAIKHGYERFTNDIDVVVAQQHLDALTRVAPQYGIKLIRRDAHGWHKLQYEGVKIEVVPEGAKPRKDAPTTIPGPRQLGVSAGLGYANLEGWMETKLGSGRRQDQADVVQVLKKADPATIEKIREHIASVHAIYLRLLEELATAAEEEKQQEKERGGAR